ncbi:Protein HOL1 [Candida viswanathii]|uniref:Protein HOL1 n=1 Tax=Candida viswanathii TaxID=5486 RepID=A0A367Y4E9_9ASCO|nr:Protein HOL1 [Candida viswanathii]
MPDLDFIVSPVQTKVEINDQENEEFIPGTLNIYAGTLDYESGDRKDPSTSTGPKVKTKGDIILFPQPSNSCNDPLNWTTLRKFKNFIIIIFITAFTAATSNDAGAVQDLLNELYGISYDSMNNSAGVLFLGIGFGTLFLTPLASLYGRKVTYFICIFLGLIGSVWFALVKSTSSAIWSQLFVGISESCAEAQVQLSLSEMYFAHNLGSVLTFYILATSIGTYLGPLLASVITANLGFRWVGWVAVFISAGTLIVIWFVMDETLFDRNRFMKHDVYHGVSPAASIESHKEKSDFPGSKKAITPDVVRSHEIVDSEEVDSTFEEGINDPPASYWKRTAMITLASNLKGTGIKQYFVQLKLLLKVFLYPPVIYSGLCWGIQNALLTFYLTVEDDQYYDPPYSYGNIAVGIMNVPCLIGAVIGCFFAGTLSDHFTIFMAKRNNGIQEAEYRLWFLFPPAIIAPVGLILFAVGTDNVWSWPPTYIGLGFIGFGYGCSGDVSMSYLMDAYPSLVIEMMTGVAVINNVMGCIFTFCCSPWLDALGNTKTFIILAVIEFVIMASAGFFIWYGKRIRIWTKSWYLEFCEIRDGI